ncbi:MAG: hypothetical protein ACK2TU_09080, partial [Anaerolineales bacterium]
VLYAITYYVGIFSERQDAGKSIVYQVIFTYAYISVLILIRRVLAKDKVLINNILWIIRLEGIKAAGNILLIAGIYYAAVVVYLCSLVLSVFYILSMIRIFNFRNAENMEFTKLGPILISLVICFILVTLGSLYAVFDQVSGMYSVTNMIMAIPFIFLIKYFKSIKINQLQMDL